MSVTLARTKETGISTTISHSSYPEEPSTAVTFEQLASGMDDAYISGLEEAISLAADAVRNPLTLIRNIAERPEIFPADSREAAVQRNINAIDDALHLQRMWIRDLRLAHKLNITQNPSGIKEMIGSMPMRLRM